MEERLKMRVAWETLIVHPVNVAVVETAGLAEITGMQTQTAPWWRLVSEVLT